MKSFKGVSVVRARGEAGRTLERETLKLYKTRRERERERGKGLGKGVQVFSSFGISICEEGRRGRPRISDALLLLSLSCSSSSFSDQEWVGGWVCGGLLTGGGGERGAGFFARHSSGDGICTETS